MQGWQYSPDATSAQLAAAKWARIGHINMLDEPEDLVSKKRRLSDKSIEVLGLIADRHSYSQIVDGHPKISYHDVFHAAEEALQLNGSTSDYHDRLAEIRSQYPKAYEPWTAADDAELAAMHEQGTRPARIAAHFQRQPSAIRSRLAKLSESP